MRTVLLLLTTVAVLCLGAPAARAQVFGIYLVDAKAEKKFRKHLTRLDDRMVLVCEPRSGIVYNPENRRISYQGDGKNEVYVANPKDPSFVPYVFKGGERKPNGSKAVVRVQGKQIERIVVLMPNQSLYGLTREYRIRREVLDGLRERRDGFDRTTREWAWEHMRMLAYYERLSSWLATTTFAPAAADIDKEVARERKKVREAANEARRDRALRSVALAETPAELVAASTEVTGGAVEFGVAESQHVRVVYDEAGLSDADALEMCTLAERAIEGFRREFVDPYLGEDFPDHIPEYRFLEFWVGPSDRDQHKRFYEVYYGEEWGDHLEDRLAVRGQTRRQEEPPEFLDYGKREDHFMPGVVANRVGQVLADLHYNANVPGMKQDWLCEAVGRYISFEFLGRTDETTYSFSSGGQYAGKKVKLDEGEVTILLGQRHAYHELALQKGRSIDQLAPMVVYSMGDPELAKAWSFYDYVAREEGELGQRWLRLACRLAREEGNAFVSTWREGSADLLGLEPADVFRELEARWRSHAEAEQAMGPEGGRR